MAQHLSHTCERHDDPFDCPDNLIIYFAKFDEYGIIIHDGGSSVLTIAYCPWCGCKLPDSKRDRWFDELATKGYAAPPQQEIPPEYETDAWYHPRVERGRG